jgi:hypothetical protein
MKFEIKYYLNENSYKSNIYAFKEIINCDRTYAINYAQNKIKYSNFKFFDIKEL